MRWRFATCFWLIGCAGCAGLAPQDRRDESMLPSKALAPAAKVSLESGLLPPAWPVLSQQELAAKGQAPPVPRTVEEPSLKPPQAEYEEVPPPSPVEPRDTLRFRLGEGDQIDGLTLAQAIDLAVENNPRLRAARARVDAARGFALQAGIWTNPRFDTNNPQVLGLGPGKNLLNAGWQMEIPVMGKKRLDRRAAEQLVREAQFGYQLERYDLLGDVREAFYGVLAAQRRVDRLVELVGYATEARDAGQEHFRADFAAKIDVLQLETQLQKANGQIQKSRSLLAAKRRALAAVIGLPNLPIDEAQGNLFGPVPRFDEAYLRQYVATRHYAIQLAEAEVTRSRVLLRRAEVEPVPNPYTGPAAQFANASQNAQFWYNIQFNIPIWDRNQGSIRAANANIANARQVVGVQRNELLRQAEDAFGRHQGALRLAERIRNGVLPPAQEAADAMRAGYRSRDIEVFRYLQAQTDLTNASLDYIDAVEDVWSTAAELGRLLQMETFP